MITLRQDNNIFDISIHDMMMIDTKANILDAFGFAGLKVAKNKPKEMLATSWERLFHDEPAYFFEKLPEAEVKMLGELVAKRQDEYIVYPRNEERFLMMQKMFFVVTYEGKDFWHIYMSDTVRSIFKGMMFEREKAMEDAVNVIADKKKQELEAAEKNADVPIQFCAAITCNPPQRMEEWQVFSQKLIHTTVMEVVLRMTKDCFMVLYVFIQDDYIHFACCWDDILDFVWKGVEEPTPWNPYTEIKKHFRKKYPVISSLFGQKEAKDGTPLPEPYLTTMGFDHQPKKWWLSTKVADKTGDDFTNWFLYDLAHDNDCADIIGALRDACLGIFDEINNSDAKTPKEKMHAYFGVKDIPEEEMIDEILVERLSEG